MPNPDHARLAAELRDYADTDAAGGSVERLHNAADAIDSQQAQIDALEKERDEAIAQIMLDAKADYADSTASEKYMAGAIAEMGTDLARLKEENLRLREAFAHRTLSAAIYQFIQHGDEAHREWLHNQLEGFLESYWRTTLDEKSPEAEDRAALAPSKEENKG